MKNPYSFAFRSTDMVWSIHSSSYFPGPACSIASHVKMYRNVRGQIWGCGELCIGGAIDTVERDLTVLGIAERPPVDAQSHLRHGAK